MIARVLLVLSLVLLCAAPADTCAAPDIADASVLDEDRIATEIFVLDVVRPDRAPAAQGRSESPPAGPPIGRLFRPPRA